MSYKKIVFKLDQSANLPSVPFCTTTAKQLANNKRIKMFKYFALVFVALFAFAAAEPKPAVVAAPLAYSAYSAPLVASPYAAAYAAPYAAYAAAPYAAYASPYAAYSAYPYSAAYVLRK
ncbi:RNA-binding protein 24-like [Bactrocera neohumeralis]|uniref:RNA-binding protein 24-like n=2 Tax=Bactrocera tyroni species complex TaxID=98808 RepID=UPI002165E67F|nr:RNA-binding protein 24-like [Bactrocera neohumeralis]